MKRLNKNIILLLFLTSVFTACKTDDELCEEGAIVGTFVSSEVICNENPEDKRNIDFEKSDLPNVYLMSIEDTDLTLQITLSDCAFSFDHHFKNDQPLNPQDTLSTDSIFMEIRYHGTGNLIENNLTIQFNTDVSQTSNNPNITLDSFTSKCEYNANK